MLFREIIGHEGIKRHLIESFRAERTAHAQLFVGAEGSGHLALALAYAQYLQCENPQGEDACGACPSCTKARKNIHPDIHFSYPTIGTGKLSTDYIKEWRELLAQNAYPSLQQWLQMLGADNQQGNINKNECVDIVKKLSLKAVEGRYKILILWMPELLGKEGNRLLKLIEEPEEDTVFILVAESSEKIINTILSRCQLVQIPRLPDDAILAYLQKNSRLDEEQSLALTYLADGNLTKALQLAQDSSQNRAYNEIWKTWLHSLLTGDGKDWVNWVEDISGTKSDNRLGRKEQILFLHYGLHFLRELVAFKVHNNINLLRLAKHEQPLIQQLKPLKFGIFQSMQQLIDDTIFFIERNAAPKPLFLDLCIKVNQLLKP
jgi:DNA polymerase III subunit delta'